MSTRFPAVSMAAELLARPSARPAPRGAAGCAHCGLSVPPGLLRAAPEPSFCCQGCAAAYAIIHDCGLEAYYQVRARVTELSPREAPGSAARDYAALDDSAYQRQFVTTLDEQDAAVELCLEGVHCAACIWLLERLPRVAPGVRSARVNLRQGRIRLVWDRSAAPLSAIARTLHTLGYPPHPATDIGRRAQRRAEDRAFLVRIGVAAVCAGNIMVLALALYGGVFSGMEAQFSGYFRIVSMLLGWVALAWPGGVFFRGALAAVRTRVGHMDVPIALALLVGGAAGTVNALRGAGEIYFDSLAMLILLLLAGRWFQQRQQRWAADAVELVYALTPRAARRVEADGALRVVSVDALAAGDELEIRAGDVFPTDGVVIQGNSSVDQALLTGEATPVSVAEGGTVFAGTVNLTAPLRVRAACAAAQSRVAELMRLVQDSAAQRTPLVQAADRIAGWFTAALIVLALVTLLLWWPVDPGRAIDAATALLIVACPCALGLATPLAIAVGLGRAARRGIFIRSGEALERLAGRGVAFFDKTGTLTTGQLRLLVCRGERDALRLAAALEAQVNHPLARAIASAAPEALTLAVTDVTQVLGDGVMGSVDGQRVCVGAPRFIARQATLRPADAAAADSIASDGMTPVVVAVSGLSRAVLGLGDALRDDAREAVDALRDLGWQPRILSGDDVRVVRRIASELSISAAHAQGGVSPEGKLHALASCDQPSMMVGDGVNDAAALARAAVGVAVKGGAEASLMAAPAYLQADGLRPIVELVRASRRVFAVVRRGFAVSLLYNAVGAALAISGLMHPLAAAVLMPLSSATVTLIAVCGRTFEERACR